MLYLIDTQPWQAEEVKLQCEARGIEFRDGFYFALTRTKLASRILKEEIAAEHGLSMDALRIEPHGKPVFAGARVHFSLTHHENIVAAVTSLTQPVGIDVTDEGLPFDDEQYALLFTERPPLHLQGHFWAAREAFLKLTGEGTREAPLRVARPAHSALPDLERLGPMAVMPFIRVESQFARLFRVRQFVGAVIAPRQDIAETRVFSSEPDTAAAAAAQF